MRRPVEVVDPDPQWPAQFEALRRELAAALGDVVVRIEHVGSTSVPGLAAKPIVDIDVVIAARGDLPLAIERLATLGYQHEGDGGVAGREAFRGPGTGTGPAHHLYVCADGADELVRHVSFRDWLRTHPVDRDRYAALKRGLAVRFRHDIDAYCNAKRGLVESILTEAVGPGFCTARTVVRPFRLDDAPGVHAVFADPEVMRYAAGKPDPDVEATRARLARYVDLQAARGFSKWVVWDRETGVHLGDAGLTVLPETGEIELGYRIARDHWGRGLATEVAAAWLEHALGPLGLPRVIAFADPRNAASLSVMDKLGMTFARNDHLAGLDCVVYEARRASPPVG